jgi:hypothetical protein
VGQLVKPAGRLAIGPWLCALPRSGGQQPPRGMPSCPTFFSCVLPDIRALSAHRGAGPASTEAAGNYSNKPAESG